MKNLLKLVCMSVLLTLSVTSCTKTDLEADNEGQPELFSTVGADEKVKAHPTDD